MSVGDVVVAVTCNKCGAVENYSLTPCAGRSWDMRDLKRDLQRDGWHVEDIDGETICPTCVEEARRDS